MQKYCGYKWWHQIIYFTIQKQAPVHESEYTDVQLKCLSVNQQAKQNVVTQTSIAGAFSSGMTKKGSGGIKLQKQSGFG